MMVRRSLLLAVVLCACVGTASGQDRPAAAAPEVDSLLARAMALHQAGDIMGAIDLYTAVLNADPNRTDARSNLGAAYVRLGRFEDAIAEYRRAIEQDPSNPTFRFNLALAFYKAGQHPDAAAEFEKVIAAQPDNAAAILLLADTLLQSGEYQRTIDVLSPREAKFLDDRAFGYMLGTALLHVGERARAQVYLDRIFKDGESAEGHLLMGTALMANRDFPGATAELRKAVELNPQLPTVHTAYGRALLGAGDHEGAVREFERALQANPNDFEANLQLGALRRRDQRHEDALVYLQRAIRLRPNDPAARFGLGGTQLTLGNVDEAREIFEQLVKDLPDYTEAHVMLANCYYRLKRKADGDRERAIAERLRLERQAREPAPGTGLTPELPTDAPPPAREP